MKMYAAKHHVGLGGYTARPGEVIEKALSEEQVAWLLSKGAIEPVPVFAEEPGQSDDQREQGDDEEEQDESQEEAEGMEEEQPPEIDVMDGITPESTPDGPKKRGGKRK